MFRIEEDGSHLQNTARYCGGRCTCLLSIEVREEKISHTVEKLGLSLCWVEGWPGVLYPREDKDNWYCHQSKERIKPKRSRSFEGTECKTLLCVVYPLAGHTQTVKITIVRLREARLIWCGKEKKGFFFLEEEDDGADFSALLVSMALYITNILTPYDFPSGLFELKDSDLFCVNSPNTLARPFFDTVCLYHSFFGFYFFSVHLGSMGSKGSGVLMGRQTWQDPCIEYGSDFVSGSSRSCSSGPPNGQSFGRCVKKPPGNRDERFFF